MNVPALNALHCYINLALVWPLSNQWMRHPATPNHVLWNIIRMLEGSTWGASADTLCQSSLVLVYSVADYAALTWGTSRHAKLVDNALYSTMRTVSGALKSAPLPCLPVNGLHRTARFETSGCCWCAHLKHAVVGLNEIPLMADIYDHPTYRLSSRSPIWTRLHMTLLRNGQQSSWGIPHESLETAVAN